jgi:hypothetical protein
VAIKTQDPPAGKLWAGVAPVDKWLHTACEALAEALRAGRVPRADRRRSRALLAQAYQALQTDGATVALLRVVDAQAHPFAPLIPRPGPPLGTLKVDLPVIDAAFAERIHAHGDIAEDIEGRVDRFLSVGDAEPLRTRAEPRPMEGHELDTELTYTEG